MKIKKEVILSIMFIISLLPMLLDWFGCARGIQEIKGTIVLFNPITILSIIMFFIGVWYSFKQKKLNNIISATSLIAIVLIEVYTFITWHYSTITGEISLKTSLQFAYPEYYIGNAISIVMIIAYFLVSKKMDTKKLK